MRYTESLSDHIYIQADFDTYRIKQEENGAFGVTSKNGIDTVGNGLEFKTISKALTYIKERIKSDNEDAKSQNRNSHA